MTLDIWVYTSNLLSLADLYNVSASFCDWQCLQYEERWQARGCTCQCTVMLNP